MRIADERLRICAPSSDALDAAILFFFQQFRRCSLYPFKPLLNLPLAHPVWIRRMFLTPSTYIGADSLPKTSKVFARLGETLGLSDENAILNVYIGKIITNLKLLSSRLAFCTFE
jgi:hypothetical protein